MARIKKCVLPDGRPGYKWGTKGTCHGYAPYDYKSMQAAKQKAKNDGNRTSVSEQG